MQCGSAGNSPATTTDTTTTTNYAPVAATITAEDTTPIVNNTNPAKDSDTGEDYVSIVPRVLVDTSIDPAVYDTIQYAYITKIIDGDAAFIEADYIQFLWNEEAIDAAAKRHDADTAYTEDGKMEVWVPNDYYIVNDSKKIRRLKLSKNVIISLVDWGPDAEFKVDNTLNGLKNRYEDRPFVLWLHKGVVVKIREKYVP